MRKTQIFFLTITFMFILIFSGCTNDDISKDTLVIVGDIRESITVNEVWDELVLEKNVYEEEEIDTADLSAVISKCDLVYDKYDVVLVASDDSSITLEDDSINDTYLGYSKQNNWIVNSDIKNIKNIKEIIIVRDTDSEEIDNSFGLNIIENDTTRNISVGELYIHEGREATFVGEVSDFIDSNFDRLLIMDKEGNYEYLYDDKGSIQVDGCKVNYKDQTNDKIYNDLQGIFIDPPQNTVMDTYYDAQRYLDNNEKVMVLFVDGLSYYQYQKITDDHKEYFISSLKDLCKKANTIFKPVTNAGFAAMITGVAPIKNGVLNRDYREVNSQTIFEYANSKNKKAKLVEAEVQIIKAGIDPILHLDKNEDGSADDELFQTALDIVKEDDTDFLLVHFHSFDDYGHDYGPFGENTLNRMEVLDDYIEKLSTNWTGKIILVADHGMHKTSEGGSHGEFRTEDLLIPYIIYNGGGNDE